jgi:hypothetical protein
VRGLHAVLDAGAVAVEPREERAVVQLQGVEVAIREGNHPVARQSLRCREHLVHHGLVLELLPFELDPGIELTHDERLGFLHGACDDLQPQGECRGLLGFSDGAEERHLAGERIGESQVVAAERGDRAPEAVTYVQCDVVLGVAYPRRPFHPQRIADLQRGEVLVEHGIQLRARDRDRCRVVARIRPPLRFGRCRLHGR